jgi:hypothetical protein
VVVDGMETTRIFLPDSLSAAPMASPTSEPVAMMMASGVPSQSFST